ncbi:MAG: ferrous iron transport protein A [Gammaproteobacteria bacterium]|nr:ferrous iron transport protein A [Gammaproteobacteria bacterium]MDH5630080.1 ferrous iron transport protein A [Gammaproteobacteria bacterium]
MQYCLADINARQKVKVVSLGAAGSVFRRKLLSMGLTPGIEVNVMRKAPMGGPMELSLRGFSLSLRKAEAQGIQVELLEAV